MVGYKSMESSDLSARSWVSTLGWYEVWVVAACSAVPCVFMLAVFELQRHRRTSFWPRARYCPGKVLDSQYPGFGAWLAPLKAIPDDEMVELVGLEAFVFIRFMRMGIRMTAFGSCIGVVLLVVFATTPHEGGALSDTFYSWTIGNVVHRSGRLWAPVVGVYLIVAHALYELFAECKAFVRLRQAFMTTAEKAAEGANIGEHGQLQSTFSVAAAQALGEPRRGQGDGAARRGRARVRRRAQRRRRGDVVVARPRARAQEPPRAPRAPLPARPPAQAQPPGGRRALGGPGNSDADGGTRGTSATRAG